MIVYIPPCVRREFDEAKGSSQPVADEDKGIYKCIQEWPTSAPPHVEEDPKPWVYQDEDNDYHYVVSTGCMDGASTLDEALACLTMWVQYVEGLSQEGWKIIGKSDQGVKYLYRKRGAV